MSLSYRKTLTDCASHLTKVRLRVMARCSGHSRTQQHHASECDIKHIVRRYTMTGHLPPGRGTPVFADVTHLQGDVTQLRTQSEAVINQANSDLLAYKEQKQKIKQQIKLKKEQQILAQKQKEERLAALKQELTELESPPQST